LPTHDGGRLFPQCCKGRDQDGPFHVVPRGEIEGNGSPERMTDRAQNELFLTHLQAFN
jgi:hypothetical protein